MVDYTLYLDESITHSGHFKDNVFCMAGIIIKDSDYELIENKLNILKKEIWGDIKNPSNVVLHQMEMIKAEKSKQDKSLLVKSEYIRFRQNRNRKRLYELLGNIFNDGVIVVIGASIDIKLMNKYYKTGNNPDNYLITLQLILENFCHFLCNNKGRGKIVYESRGMIEDQQMLDRYFAIKLMGSMYYSKEIMNKRLLSMNFKEKNENDAGLQIADFVPNYFARKHKGLKKRKFNIDKQLRIYRYDGGIELREKFGVKQMP